MCEEINECPACGEEADIDIILEGNSDDVIGYYITCQDCEMELTMMNVEKKDIIKMWNSILGF